MPGAATQLKKFAIVCHRWTGAAFCILFCWWFLSGIFMMYCDYPEVKSADRLAHALPLDALQSSTNARAGLVKSANERRAR